MIGESMAEWLWEAQSVDAGCIVTRERKERGRKRRFAGEYMAADEYEVRL
jgi:hypothetical protein